MILHTEAYSEKELEKLISGSTYFVNLPVFCNIKQKSDIISLNAVQVHHFVKEFKSLD